MKRRSLGRGLDSLIPRKNAEQADGSHETIDIDLITPGEAQPRRDFEPEALGELADSIRQKGIIQPIVVRRKNGGFEIVAGERRWRASRMAGLSSIPVVIREASDLDAAELTLVENIQRQDLNPIEEARAYDALVERFSLTHEEISKKTGKTRSAVTNRLRLLRLTERTKEALVSGKITAGHARALLAVESPRTMDSLLDQVVKKDLTVRKTERLVKKFGEHPPPVARARSAADEEDIFTKNLTEELAERFSTRVKIRHGKSRGKIEIEFYSVDDLDRIVDMLLSRG